MNLIYYEMSSKISESCKKGYKSGLASIVKLNKKNILKLQESILTPSQKEIKKFSEPLFKISYTDNDERLLKNFDVESFTIAGVLSYECEEKLKAMAKSIIDGSHPYMQKHPESDVKDLWRDEAYNILADYIEVEDMPPPGILNTNLRTAVNSSYHAAQYQRLQELKDVYPAYRYLTREDDRVREKHIVLHGKVFMANDPIWDIIWPPNGWNCRCYIEPLTYDELAKVDPNDVINIANNILREEYIKQMAVEKDFSRNSGKVESIWGKWLNSKMKDIDFSLVTKKLIADAESRKMNEEIWGEYIHSGLTKKIMIKLGNNEINVKIDDKEIKDTITNIDKYRRGVLMNG